MRTDCAWPGLQGISKDVESLAGLLVAGKALDEETAQKASKALNDLASAQRQLSATKQVCSRSLQPAMHHEIL